MLRKSYYMLIIYLDFRNKIQDDFASFVNYSHTDFYQEGEKTTGLSNSKGGSI